MISLDHPVSKHPVHIASAKPLVVVIEDDYRTFARANDADRRLGIFLSRRAMRT